MLLKSISNPYISVNSSLYFFLIFLILNSFPLYTQDTTLSIDKVEIISLPFNESWEKSGSNTHIILKDNLEKESPVYVSDIYNKVPGIYMHQGTQNTSRITIRGIGSRTPYASNRIRAYYNEIPLTSGDGITIIEDIDISNIGKIEIVKGPSSALYGSGLGGSINIISPSQTNQGIHGVAETNVGSFNAMKNRLSLGYKKGNFSIRSSVIHRNSDGYRQNNEFNKNAFNLHSQYTVGKHSLRFTFLYTDLKAEIPSSLNRETYLTSPSSAAQNWLGINGFEEYDKILSGFTHLFTINSTFSNTLSLFGGWHDLYESRPFNILGHNGNFYGLRDKFRIDFDKWQNQIGIEYFEENIEWNIYETIEGEQGDQTNSNVEKRTHINLFYHTLFNLTNQLTLEGGLNYNQLTYQIEDQFDDNIDNSGDYRYDPVLSPRLGISYQPISLVTMFASASHGFSMPTLEETLLPEGDINENLKPEKGWNYEIGAKGKLFKDRLIYSASAYNIDLTDLLVTKRVTEEIFTGINAGSTTHQGIEAWIRLNAVKKFGYNMLVTIGYTHSSNVFNEFTDEGIVYDGNQLPGIPKNQINVQVRTDSPFGLSSRVSYTYAGKQYLNDANSLTYKGHHLIDYNLNYGFKFKSSTINIYGIINNLYDVHYASMILINAPSFGGSEPRYYYPGLPFNFRIGIKVEI